MTLKQAAEGGFLIGGGWPARMRGGPVVNEVSMLRNLAVAKRVLPGLADASVVRSWAAIVNGTADWHPILGEAPGVPGFFLNLFPWMGFTAAPAVSEALADLALGYQPALDLSLFSLRSDI
ncbi:FAD-dependent oxidoreductase [Fontisubflavum oceani]|uniref:NAD(P)/FAD-dependent oxidoreductase n=1 Tax=Fontisubflavum oceani TaxID=2978973 RepID=UPI0025B2D800|nr:FAD-dependent oxidoreductase [Fontisubflavum oceani]WJY21125.1 FAD-dependent oxidoreductase [Fontisubflavum oceani]